MRIFLGYETACNFWRFATSEEVARVRVVAALPSARSAHTKDQIDEIAQALGEAGAQRPVHMVLPVGMHPAPVDGVVFHSVRQHPRNIYMQVLSDVYVSSPELSFVQAATDFSLPQLVLYGCDLCGSYAVTRGGAGAFAQRDPLLTVERLKAAATAKNASHGKAAATRALRYVVEQSPSPFYSAYAVLLTLPMNLGGYGLPQEALIECNVLAALGSLVEEAKLDEIVQRLNKRYGHDGRARTKGYAEKKHLLHAQVQAWIATGQDFAE